MEVASHAKRAVTPERRARGPEREQSDKRAYHGSGKIGNHGIRIGADAGHNATPLHGVSSRGSFECEDYAGGPLSRLSGRLDYCTPPTARYRPTIAPSPCA